MFYFVVFFQTAINTGVSIGCVLLAGECLKVALFSMISTLFTCLLLSQVSFIILFLLNLCSSLDVAELLSFVLIASKGLVVYTL